MWYYCILKPITDEQKQQLVRFTIIQYREELLKIQQDEAHQELDLAQREAMKRSIREQAQDERDEVVVDMLSILQKIPIQVLGKCHFRVNFHSPP